MFQGRADWDEIARVVEALDIPVVGNGDIRIAEDVVRMQQHTGCAAVMVGRGSFGNPWLFRDAAARLRGDAAPPAPSAAEKFTLALEHALLAIRLQGDSRKTVVEFRKHLGWYTRGLPGAGMLRERLFRVESMIEVEAVFRAYLEQRTEPAVRAA
jgi:tRNA-dihydrouridine synthase